MRDVIWPMFLKGYIYTDEHGKGPHTAVEKFIMQQKKDVISHSVIYSPAPITVSGCGRMGGCEPQVCGSRGVFVCGEQGVCSCVGNRVCVCVWGCTVC